MGASELTKLVVGEQCWVLNGIRSRAFLCEVIAVRPGEIVVRNLDKSGLIYSFDVLTGNPTGPYRSYGHVMPLLVTLDDERARALDESRLKRSHRGELIQLAVEMPSPEAFLAARQLIDRWEKEVIDDASAAAGS